MQPRLIAAIFLSVFMIAMVGWGAIGSTGDSREVEWGNPPDVFICKNAPVDRFEVQKAVKFWEGKGFKFGMVFENFDCPNDKFSEYSTMYIPGSIMIYPPNKMIDRFGELGATLVGVKDDVIIYSIVEVVDDRERLLEHELGHSLGIRHIRIEGNIMHPSYKKGGWKTNRI